MAFPLSREVSILSDPESVAQEAAILFSATARRAIASTGRFTVALSGGSSPLRFFSLLASDYRNQVSWQEVHFFWVDERCVPPDQNQSNFKAANKLLLIPLSFPERNIHRIRGELPPQEAASEYEQDLRNFFGDKLPLFDLLILGIGEDCHTASLFPDAPSLREKAHSAIAVYAQHLDSWRVTLTLPALNNSALALFLATGKGKAKAVAEAVSGKTAETCPAGLVKPSYGKLRWLLDLEAASGLNLRR